MRKAPTWPFKLSSGVPPAGRDMLPTRRSGSSRFVPLFNVTYRHGYFDLSRGRFPGFTAMPTPTSADLMRGQGMVFQSNSSGFNVYMDENRLQDLVSYLRRQGGPEYWTRLSFALVSEDPAFIGITALPIDTNQSVVNIYGCNSTAHREHGLVLLMPGSVVTKDALYPLCGSDISEPVTPPGMNYVEVQDISGQPVLTVTVPPDIKPPPSFVQVNMGSLPFGLYTIATYEAVFDKDGHPVSKVPLGSRVVLYSQSAPLPTCFLDILFTRPTPDTGGIYPIPSLFDRGTIPTPSIGRISYELTFAPRSTKWQYYIVSQTKGARLEDLRIEGEGADFKESAHPVILPDGRPATLFESVSTLPLRLQSPQRFRLRGRRRSLDGRENDIRVDCLPVAPKTPVWPLSADDPMNETGISEMYVYV